MPLVFDRTQYIFATFVISSNEVARMRDLTTTLNSTTTTTTTLNSTMNV